MILCPKCQKPLLIEGKTYKCEDNHCFDIAKEGYVNLLLKHSAEPGDSVESVKSRNDFLNKGYYKTLAICLTETLDRFCKDGFVALDAGCGTGYYLNYIINHGEPKINWYATDISKKAVSMCSKLNKDATCFVGNVFHLPFDDNSLDLLMSVFTPYSSQEFNRVVKKGGYVVAVTPGKYHLYDLKEIVYENPYLNSEDGYSLEGFKLVNQFNAVDKIRLTSNEDINNLWKMMPYYHTTSKENNDKLLTRDEAVTEIDFLISLYCKE